MKITDVDIQAIRLGRYILNTYSDEAIEQLNQTIKAIPKDPTYEKPPAEFIRDVVLEECDVSLEQFLSDRRFGNIVYARQAFCYLVVKIHDPESVASLSDYRYGSYLKAGIRILITSLMAVTPAMVSIYYRKMNNYVKNEADTRAQMEYLEELILTKYKVQ